MNKKGHGSKRSQCKNAKNHLGFGIRASDMFCNVCNVFVPKGRVVRVFLTIEPFFANREKFAEQAVCAANV